MGYRELLIGNNNIPDFEFVIYRIYVHINFSQK
jgi:hypothetical protein